MEIYITCKLSCIFHLVLCLTKPPHNCRERKDHCGVHTKVQQGASRTTQLFLPEYQKPEEEKQESHTTLLLRTFCDYQQQHKNGSDLTQKKKKKDFNLQIHFNCKENPSYIVFSCQGPDVQTVTPEMSVLIMQTYVQVWCNSHLVLQKVKIMSCLIIFLKVKS